MRKKVFIRCKHCGHNEEANKALFAKIIGGLVTAMGYWAWVSFLFAGTGFAMPICIAIMAGGVAIVAFSDQITGWLNKMYSCPKCGRREWEILTFDELFKEGQIREKDEMIKNQEKKIVEKDEMIKNQVEEISKKLDDTIKNQEKFLSNFDTIIQNREANSSNERMDETQLRDLFHSSIKHAKEELDIYTPTLGARVFGSTAFQEELLGALNRGCLVKIRCGFNDSNDETGRRKLTDKVNHFVNDPRFHQFFSSGMLRFKIDDSHAKLFIVDTEYYVLSSMNFLSNPGTDMEYDGKIRQRWGELGEKSADRNNLLAYRGEYFSF